MLSKTTSEFRNWQIRMGYTQRKAASLLGISISTFRYYHTGKRRDTKGSVAYKVKIPRSILLACAAIEAGLKFIGE